MSSKIEFVQLEAEEDALSVKDRLAAMRGQQVLIIWPEEGTALTRKLDLVLVQREAMRRAIRIALVTHDETVIRHADELNISTFETIGASQRGRWKRGRSKVFTSRFDKPDEEQLDAETLKPLVSRLNTQTKAATSGLVRLLVIVALLAAVAALAYLVVPSAIITLTPAEEIIEIEAPLIASPIVTSSDVETGTIPARIRKIEIEEVGTRPTTGIETLNPVAATGLIAFFNKTADTITIPAGTVVSTSTGDPIRFTTMLEVRLAAGVDEFVEVSIMAQPDSAGTVGNVEAGLINTVEAEWRESVTVINMAATTGGEDRTLPKVTEADRDRLIAAVRQQLLARAWTEFENQLAENEILIAETITIAPEGEREDWKIFDGEVGEFRDTVGLKMRAIVQVVVIDKRRGEDVVFARIGRRIPRGRSIDPSSLEYTWQPVTGIDADGQVSLSIKGTGRVIGQVNVETLQNRLAGMTLEEAQLYLNNAVDLATGTTPSITLSPDFMAQMPMLPMRITIQVTES